jgi:hypothetical protein
MGKHSLVWVCLATLAAVSLTACAVAVLPPHPIEVAGTGDSEKVVMDIGPDGMKHIVWFQDDTNELFYYYTFFGEERLTLSEQPDWGWYAQYDVAVADNNTVYIVWRHVQGATTGVHEYTSFIPITPPLAGLAPEFMVDPLDGPGMVGNSAPKVVARGEDVYAVYDRLGTTHTVYYKQLAGGTSQGIVQDGICTSCYIRDTNLAIDSAGYLHVAFQVITDTLSTVVYNSNATVDGSGNMNQMFTFSKEGYSVFEISLATYGSGSLERVSLAYSFWDNIYHKDRLYLDTCKVAGCSDKMNQEVDFSAYANLYVYRITSVGIGNIVYLAFVAKGPDNHILLYTYSSTPTLTLIATPGSLYVPDLFVVDGNGLPVIGWRSYDSSEPDEYDAFVYFPVIGISQVYDGINSYAGYLDMVSAHGYLAGVISDQLSATNTRVVPWLITLGHPVYLPVVRR